MMIHRYWLIIVCIRLVVSINPGILLTIPFPQSPPLSVVLPQPIAPILLYGLELTNVNIRKLDYNYQITAPTTSINASYLISFDWSYQSDKGKGSLIQTNFQVTFTNNFTTTQQNRFMLKLTTNKLKLGQVKVQLGGNVKQTLVVQITNLVVNHASIIFRKTLQNKLSSTLSSFNSYFSVDIKLYCKKHSQTECIYINTTLVSTPKITNSQILIIALNAAPYWFGKESSALNPNQILINNNVKSIQIQIHKKMIEQLIRLLMEDPFELVISTMKISSTVDINSKSLAMLFPPMERFLTIKDVICQVKLDQISFDIFDDHFQTKVKGTIIVSTEDLKTRNRQLYLLPVHISGSFVLLPVFGHTASSLRVDMLEVTELVFDQQDIQDKKVVPDALIKYLGIFMEWTTQAINFQLNKELLPYDFVGINMLINGHGISNYGYCLDVMIGNQ